MLKVRRSAKAAGLAVVCHLALACSSDGEGANRGGSLINGGEEGIYQLTASTFNEAGCDAEGPSELEQSEYKYLYMANRMGGTQMYVSVHHCANPEDCRVERRAELSPTGSSTGSAFFETSAGFIDGDVRSATVTNGQCVGGTLRRQELSRSGDSFQIETRTSMPPPFPVDRNGQCFNISLRDDVESGTCLEYRVERGTFSEPL